MVLDLRVVSGRDTTVRVSKEVEMELHLLKSYLHERSIDGVIKRLLEVSRERWLTQDESSR